MNPGQRSVLSLFAGLLLLNGGVAGLAQERHVVLLAPKDSSSDIIRKAANVVPTRNQWLWQQQEFIAFVHFGTNTFTDREWGEGAESPTVFNPADLDARQWAKVVNDAGMKMIIVTAKHHDGLCLWPTKYTDHSIKNSPWKNGNGDMVGEVAAACKEYGLKFGVYLSPWDRHEPSYGDSPKYNEHFRNQLRELLTNYGEVSEVWFDGACGEGPNGKRQEYDWPSYYKLIRELQPNAVIAIMGPDVRWVGTESGYGRETEWSVLPMTLQNQDSIALRSQQNPVDGAFTPGDLTVEDLGSREKIRKARALAWYPAETDVSIRPGWFYHASQDNQVKSPEKLVDIYYSSVGRNSVLLLNLPPDKHGRIHENDIKNLMGMRKILDQTFKTNLIPGASATATNERSDFRAASILDKNHDSYWTTDEGVDNASIEITLKKEEYFDRLLLQENIRVGQRIEAFHLDAWDGTRWRSVVAGTTIGYKRLLRFAPVRASRIRLTIDRSRTSPTLSTVGLFKAPPGVSITPESCSFEKNIIVELATDLPQRAIHYTIDGTEPTVKSARYQKPIRLSQSTLIKAVAVLEHELCAEISTAQFLKCLPVKLVTYDQRYSHRYTGRGDSTIINGKRGPLDFHDKEWLGFEKEDMTVILDLGAVRSFSKVSAGFLQQQGSWIFLPTSVQFFVSENNREWKLIDTQHHELLHSEQLVVKDFSTTVSQQKAQYIKVRATNVGTCPPWHQGAGDKAWLFIDEVFVE